MATPVDDSLNQPGAISVSALNGKSSASADAARLRQIRADLSLTPLARIRKALALGIQSRAWQEAVDDGR